MEDAATGASKAFLSSPLPSRLCGAFPPPLPPPRLLGKFSGSRWELETRVRRGAGAVAGRGGGEGLQRGANWDAAARGWARARTHTRAHPHAPTHTLTRAHACTPARPPGAAAMQGRHRPAGTAARPARRGPAWPALGTSRDVTAPRFLQAADGAVSGCFSPSVARLSILCALFAPHSHPRWGGGVLGREFLPSFDF